MPTYQIQAPNGQIYRIEGPEGATDEQVRAKVLEQFPDAGQIPAPILDTKGFQQEVLKRARAGEDPAKIREWAKTVRQPDDESGLLRYDIGPELEAVSEQLRGGYQGPVQMQDVTERNAALPSMARGALDAATFNFADEIQAGLQTGFGMAGDYEATVNQLRAQRAMDDPTARFTGQLIGSVTAPMAVLRTPGAIGRGAQAVEQYLTAPGATGARGLFSRMNRVGLAGAGANVLAGQGAATDERPADPLSDAALGYVLGSGGQLAGETLLAGGGFLQRAREGFDAGAEDGAARALREAGLDVNDLPQRIAQRFEDTGRAPAIAEVLTPAEAAQFTAVLSRSREARKRVQAAAEQQVTDILPGVRQRFGDSDPVGAAEASLLANTRRAIGEGDFETQAEEQLRRELEQRIGTGDFVPGLEEELRAGLRQEVAPLEAKSADVLDMERRLLDKENYGELASITVPVDKRDIAKLNKFVAKVPFDSEDATQIRSLYNSGTISADSYDRIRRGLADLMERSKYSKDIYAQRVKELDEMFGELLPQVAQARRESFEARSLVEGAQRGRQAIRDLGSEPGRVQQNLGVLTPERQAGVPIGGALAVQDLTSSVAKARRFADAIVMDVDYPTTIRKVLPPSVAESVINLARAGTDRIAQVEALGLKGSAANAKKAYDLANKITTDPAYVGALRRQLGDQITDDLVAFAEQHKNVIDGLRRLDLRGVGDDAGKAYKLAERIVTDPRVEPEIRRLLPKNVADDLLSFAGQQKARIDEVRSLGFNNIEGDVNQSYRFAEKLTRDPEYARKVIEALPAGRGQELVDFATSQKRAIDSLAAMARIPQEKIDDALRGAAPAIDIAAAFGAGGGGAFKAGIVNEMLVRANLGEGAANRLADMLLVPGNYEKALKAAEKLGVSRSQMRNAIRNSFVMLAGQVANDNAQMPGNFVTTTREEPQ